MGDCRVDVQFSVLIFHHSWVLWLPMRRWRRIKTKVPTAPTQVRFKRAAQEYGGRRDVFKCSLKTSLTMGPGQCYELCGHFLS